MIYCTISKWNTRGFLIHLQNSALQKKANSELPFPKSLAHDSVASSHYLLPTQTKLSPKKFHKFLLSLWKTRAEQLLNSMRENRQPQSNSAESKPDASSIIKIANANEQPVFVSCEVVSCILGLETTLTTVILYVLGCILINQLGVFLLSKQGARGNYHAFSSLWFSKPSQLCHNISERISEHSDQAEILKVEITHLLDQAV